MKIKRKIYKLMVRYAELTGNEKLADRASVMFNKLLKEE